MIPILVSFDFGGVLKWTQYVSSFAVITAVLLSCAAMFGDRNPGGLKQHVLLIPMILWILYSLLHVVSLSPDLVHTLSPGSYAAYTQWLEPILPASELPTSFPISIAPHDSQHATAVLALVFGLVFASSMVFHSRPRIAFLLGCLAVGAAAQAAFGLTRLAFPNADLFDAVLDNANATFGAFINRNNAALFMNIGLACSLGLLSWRLMALTGQEVDDDQFELNDLMSLVSDRYSITAIVSSVFCVGGILLCGSRGGMIAMVAGALLAFGWIRQRRGWLTLPVVVASIGIAAAVLLTPLRLSLASIKRFEFFSPNADTILNDGRMMHWPDGWQAGLAHLPTGSGFSTYAYAYLPHQGDGIRTWAHHADNLWLEMFVEQGIMGVLLALSIFVILIRALRRLGQSPDPIDQGLRATGWYLVGAILVSQLFDFGLSIPANLFAVAILIPAIISRDAANSMLVTETAKKENQDQGKHEQEISDFQPRKRKSLFESQSDKRWMALVAIVSVVIPVLSLSQLKRSSEVESIVRNCRYEFKSIERDQQALKDWSQRIESKLGDSPESHLLTLLGDIEYQRARLQETIAQRPKSVAQADEIYQRLNPINRRKNSVPESESKLYTSSIGVYNRSLLTLPLGSEARSAKLYMDFVVSDPQFTNDIIDQLHALHHNDPITTMLVGEYAADSGRLDFATELWKSAIDREPNLTDRALENSRRYAGITYLDVVPNSPKRVRLVASRLMNRNDADTEMYLTHAMNAVACDECDSLEERSGCLSLRGDIAFKLNDYELAFKQYQDAIKCEPANSRVRLKLINRLRGQGRNREALIEARKARFAIPENDQFDAVIKRMAADDLRQLKNK